MYYYGYTNEKTNKANFQHRFCGIKELKCVYDSHQSFNGRAYVGIDDKCNEFLISYNTVVMGYDPKTGEFHRLWCDWSATTGRHIREFCRQLGYPAMSKKMWDSMPVETWEGF